MADSDPLLNEERLTINREFESLDAFVHEYVTNIPRSGAFVRSQHPLPVGTKVNLRFTVFTEEVEHIEGIGQVVRVETEPPGMGVVFTSLSLHSQTLLPRLLTAPRPPTS